ncbi:hypothetical protein [Bifidobacterium pseudocatenulatum]|nr:hypothetical protein [Bifidobacterium pseudocatenulatum]
MKRDLKEISVQLDNLNVPAMGFVLNFAKERKVSSNGNYYYSYDEGGKKSQRSRKKSKHKTDSISTK